MGQEIVPRAGAGVFLSEEETSTLAIVNEEDETRRRVELDEDFLPIQAIDANLDLDEPEEQILLVKRRSDPADRIRVLVTDFDTLRNTHRITWEGETSATNVRTFALYIRDLIGDHLDELVCFGTNNLGLQTLEVFRRDQGTTSVGLSYREILQVTTDASIEIEERPRSDAYRTLQSNGVSFPIHAFRRNHATEAPLDLVKTSYYWRLQQGRYVAELEEEIPGMVVEESQLQELYDGDVEAVEAFLDGPWYRAAGEDLSTEVEMAHFDVTSRTVALFREGSQERYGWQNSYKSLSQGGAGVWMNLNNEILGRIRRQLSVTVLGLDSIFVSVSEAEYWNGRYQRMTPGLQESVVYGDDSRTPPFSLAGVFVNDNNEEFLFSEPFFTFRSDHVEWTGGYNLFEMGSVVLELKVLADQDGQRGFSRQYIAEVSELESDDRVIRQLTLTPATVTVRQIQEAPGDEIVLEQVVDRDG